MNPLVSEKIQNRIEKENLLDEISEEFEQNQEIKEIQLPKVVGFLDLSKMRPKDVIPKNSIKVPEEVGPKTKQKEVKRQITDPALMEKISLTFFEDKDQKIISRIPNGKIAIIDFEYQGEWVKKNETWLCAIKADLEKKIIIIPIEIQRTSEQNQEIFLNSFPHEEFIFFTDKENRLISRMENGKIAIIDSEYNHIQIKNGETWRCAIKSELDKKVIIIPMLMIHSSDYNDIIMAEKISELEGKEWNKPMGKVLKPNYGKTEKRYKNRNND